MRIDGLMCLIDIKTIKVIFWFHISLLLLLLLFKYVYMCPWSTDAVISSTGIFVAITYNIKIINFSFMQKIIRY